MPRIPFLILALTLSTLAFAAPPDLSGPMPERIRGAYMGTNNDGLLPKMQETGMNAAIVKFNIVEDTLADFVAAEFADWAAKCEATDLAFMPVFNLIGGHEPRWMPADLTKYVDAKGQELAKTACPADATFWRRFVTDRFLAVARAAGPDSLGAICLDTEMYGADVGVYRAPCFCDACFARFMAAKNLTDELPARADRVAWLDQRELSDAYAAHQTAEIAAHATACRKALHELAPGLRMGVLHLTGDSPMHHGMARGFGTENLPVICLTERTYSSGYDDYLSRSAAAFTQIGAHVDILGGIWHSKFPAENFAEQYYHMARNTIGYWVYTVATFEVPKYHPLPGKPDGYWQAIADANAELDKLAREPAYQTALRIREFVTPAMPLTDEGFRADDLVPYAPRETQVAHPRLRTRNLLYLHANEGDQIEMEILFKQIGNYRGYGRYLLLQPDGTELASGEIKKTESAKISIAAARTGVHGLAIQMGSNACQVVKSSHPYALSLAGDRPTAFITHVPALLLLPKPGAETAALSLRTEGPHEGVKATFKDQAGELIAEMPITGIHDVELPLPEGIEYLSLHFEGLPDAVMEDIKVTVVDGLYPYAATLPAGLLKPAD